MVIPVEKKVERETLGQIIDSGELEGYRSGPPPGIGIGRDIDHGVCGESSCEHCGHEGLTYRPFHRSTGYGYRAFAVCPACQHATEF